MADRGTALMQQAKAKYDSFGWWSNDKYDEAAEMYKKAANQFKLSKDFDKAGEAFLKAAECYAKLNSKYEIAQSYMSAAAVVRKSNPQESIRCFKVGIEFYLDEGRFSMAAKHTKEIAEMYEQEGDLENAEKSYTQAADYFEGEGQVSHANGCLLKVALFTATLEKYDRSIEVYEKVARGALENNLLKWSVKDYLFRASLCQLCLGDMVAARRALERYQGMDHSYASSRESKLISGLIEAVDESDLEKFNNEVSEFDSISPLEPWKTTLLLRVKNKIKDADEDIL
eukprot:TRINITY_DN8081_c0_g1_i1.p2 TRINITY_DN8081_c0_g1~~TRINITY_DN8081_c0_g1_i1.p2  ORF type:complete len:285 (+),score=120.76 TRINITY_DN8081_c0_g1_i1:34-888(+)